MGWARLTDHDAGTGTPRGSKEEDVDINEGDLGIDGGNVKEVVRTSTVFLEHSDARIRDMRGVLRSAAKASLEKFFFLARKGRQQ